MSAGGTPCCCLCRREGKRNNETQCKGQDEEEIPFKREREGPAEFTRRRGENSQVAKAKASGGKLPSFTSTAPLGSSGISCTSSERRKECASEMQGDEETSELPDHAQRRRNAAPRMRCEVSSRDDASTPSGADGSALGPSDWASWEGRCRLASFFARNSPVLFYKTVCVEVVLVHTLVVVEVEHGMRCGCLARDRSCFLPWIWAQAKLADPAPRRRFDGDFAQGPFPLHSTK
jgi:hypothetical protein